ncbi:DNA-binding response regulator [Caulobacter sp. CCUG 60055]|uniref:response regulator transcription factor n=1 Tax=Caulobacter sp. CCUG 60055 TaxID=2100090 RepID=UPI0003C143A9|nr:response regulator transcription factor [Caulobacter sp. CCUG 60055]MBQ1541915.1 response regulator transcription factor [Caulobacteraceae bacterium]MCI3181230.1 DNA-binding response regulator [Caulobacter sp. CCUG 60055]
MSILLVEDDLRVADFLIRGLEAEGHSVAHAKDGPEGYARATSENFDVLVLDVMLPGFSGKELCRKLRLRGLATPILMLTAMDATEDKIDGLRGGADDYLTKPFDFDELLARVEALARRGRGFDAGPPPRVVIGEVSLDRDAMEIRKSGRVVELTAKEYQLLDLLMSAPGKVMSRTRILNKVWGYDSDPLTNVVDVYIRRIRAKLELDPEAGLIRTVRGYGYKIDAGD